MKKKISIPILILGVALLIIAPILGYTMNKVVLYERKPVTINEDSEDSLQEAFAYPFSIKKDQKVTVEFSVYYANVTATLKIFGKGFFDQQFALNSTPPDLLTGQNFIYSQFVWGQEPYFYTFSSNEVSITYNGYWYIEFGGGTSGDYLISIPGSYVVVVYGDNDGPIADTEVKFNIVIKIDGPGDLLEEIFYYLGTGVLVALVLFISYGYYKKFKGGR